MKTEHFYFTGPSSNLHSEHQPKSSSFNFNSSLLHHRNLGASSDKDSVCSVAGSSNTRGKRNRTRAVSMRSSKGITKKSKTMDYTNYAYNEAVGRLKLMLADSYATPKSHTSYMRNLNEDSTDNYSDNMSVIDRPVLSDISKYLSPSQKARITAYRPRKTFSTFSSSKENLALPQQYHHSTTTAPFDYLTTTIVKPQAPPPSTTAIDSVQAPVEIFSFIEKQEDYIDQLEKESKYCRNELTNLLGKVKDVINENEQLTETARNELAVFGGASKNTGAATSPSTDSAEEHVYATKKSTSMMQRKKDTGTNKSPRYASAPNIVYESRISELEAELMQANIDLKRLKTENEELKRKLSKCDPQIGLSTSTNINCDAHRKQIDRLQMDKSALEETIRQLQKSLDEAKSQQQFAISSKRYVNDVVQMERSQSEMEVKHLREELDRQHERVRELQHEMARRIADERANAERRYNNQVDQLGGDLSNQWEQVAKLQMELEREKRYEADMKRDLANRNVQIEELKMELRSNRSTFLADIAQVNAEKQSLEQEITALRLQLDRTARDAKTEAARLNAEINSLRQRLDRGDADLLHSKREVLRLNDEIANLEKELAYGELKNEIRPTKKDLDKRMSEMQEKHAETVNELEEMIQNQKQLMDKLTNECKMLTNKLEDTTLKHNLDKQHLREMNEKLMERLKQIWANYKQMMVKCDEQHSTKMLCSSHSTSDTESLQDEEHFFSNNSLNDLKKPLSTTNRPHLLRPTIHEPQSMITPPSHQYPHTITTPYLANRQHPTELSPQMQQQQPQQQQHQHHQQPRQEHPHTNLVIKPIMSPSQVPPPLAMHSMTTSPAIATTSATMTTTTMTMMKISKTTLEREKNNNSNSNSCKNICSNNNNNNRNHSIEVLPIRPQMILSNQLTTSAKTTIPPNRRRVNRTWPPLQMITIPNTAATRAMTNSHTIQASTTQAHTINTTMMANKSSSSSMVALNHITAQDNYMIQALDKMTTPTTEPQPITPQINPLINMNHQRQFNSSPPSQALLLQRESQQKWMSTWPPLPHCDHHHRRPHHNNSNNNRVHPRQYQQQQQQQYHGYHNSHNHKQQHHQQHQQQQSLRHLQLQSVNSLMDAPQQKAAINRERAQALWGQQLLLEQSAAENPICHNSLPRQQPKSSCYPTNDVNKMEMFDPFELEFSISSPSLMRSCDSDTCTEVGDNEFDSISNMSISPAPTAIRKSPPSRKIDNGGDGGGDGGSIEADGTKAANEGIHQSNIPTNESINRSNNLEK